MYDNIWRLYCLDARLYACVTVTLVVWLSIQNHIHTVHLHNKGMPAPPLALLRGMHKAYMQTIHKYENAGRGQGVSASRSLFCFVKCRKYTCKQYINMEMQDEGKTCLHQAAYGGCFEFVKLLVEKGGRELIMTPSFVSVVFMYASLSSWRMYAWGNYVFKHVFLVLCCLSRSVANQLIMKF